MSVASFHLVRYPRAYRSAAMSKMWFDRAPLAATDGLRFWRLMGTARGRSMSWSADLDRWGLFCVWEDDAALDAFLTTSAIPARWAEAGQEACTVRLAYAGGHGAWGGSFPFAGEHTTPVRDAPVAVLTRAAIRPRRLVRFYRSVPAVDASLAAAPGLVRSVGLGEWPLARQVTFSVWDSVDAVTAFAYRGDAHRAVVRRTRTERWFGEEMFCRFRVAGATGIWDGTPALPATVP